MISGVTVREAPYSEDPRGWFLKAVPKEYVGQSEFGEIYISAAHPGETRGNHYHDRTAEWFCVIRGAGTLRLEDISTGERMILTLTGENRLSVEIPPLVAHSIHNDGDCDLYLLAFANVAYCPESPDTTPWNLQDPVS